MVGVLGSAGEVTGAAEVVMFAVVGVASVIGVMVGAASVVSVAVELAGMSVIDAVVGLAGMTGVRCDVGVGLGISRDIILICYNKLPTCNDISLWSCYF